MNNYRVHVSCIIVIIYCLYILSGTLSMDISSIEEETCLFSLDAMTSEYTCDSPDTEWIIKIGSMDSDYARSVLQTPDGGYIIAGFTYSYGSFGDIWLIKTDHTGQTMWIKSYGGVREDYGYDVKLTSDGGYIIVGYTMSQGNGDKDIWLIKTNSLGDVLWHKTYGDGTTEWAHSVYESSDGGYGIAGFKGSNHAGNAWIIKTDQKGTMEWEKILGGAARDTAQSIQQTKDGGYIITGYTSSQGEGDENVWLIKTDSKGNIEWEKTYGDLYANRAYCVQETSDNGYIIAGWTDTTHGTDMLLIKTNHQGIIQFQKTYGGLFKGDYGFSVQQTYDEGYILVGYTYSNNAQKEDILVVKTNSEGNLLWNKTYGGPNSDWGWAVQQTSDGGYIIAGDTWSADPRSCNVWLIKIAPCSLPPQTPTAPQGPSDGVTNVSYTYSTSALDPQGLQVKYYFDWGDGTGTWTNYSSSGTFQEACHAWDTPGTYHLRVKAQNQEGGHSDYSSTVPLVISSNFPPVTPQRPMGSESGKIRKPYSYSTSTTDPDNDMVYYLFDWGDCTENEWIGPYTSGDIVTCSHTWETPGTYHLRVKARDNHTLESQWSESLVVALPLMPARWIELVHDIIQMLFRNINTALGVHMSIVYP